MKKIALVAVLALTACGPSVKSITVEPAAVTLAAKGTNATLKATPKDEKGGAVADAQVTWSSSNKDVASVEGGKVTALKSGETTITAATGEVKGTAKVTVSIPASVKVDPAAGELMTGSSVSLKASVTDDAGKPMPGAVVQWTSSDDKVASVANGSVTGKAAGAATITAALGTLKAEAKITVKAPEFDKVSIDPAKPAIDKAGGTVQLTLKVTFKGSEVKGVAAEWSSSDPKTATVDATGKVTAVKKGKAKITAKAGEKSASVEVAIKK